MSIFMSLAAPVPLSLPFFVSNLFLVKLHTCRSMIMFFVLIWSPKVAHSSWFFASTSTPCHIGESLKLVVEKIDVFCYLFENVLNIFSCLCRSFYKMIEWILVHYISYFIFFYSLLIIVLNKVTPSPNKIFDHHTAFSILIDLVHPFRYIFKRWPVCEVETDYDSIRVFIEKSCNWAKFFFPCCVPNL